MKAIILKKTQLGEADEIITLFTEEQGKVRVIAKALKSPKSKLAFGLQPLFLSEVELIRGRKNFTITGVKPINTFKYIREDIKKVQLAMYATELLMKASADEHPNAKIFNLYKSFLEHLDESQAEHFCLGCFVFELLGLSGYSVQFENCMICKKQLEQTEQVSFSNNKSGLLCSACAGKASDSQKISAQLFKFLSTGRSLDFAEQDKFVLSFSELQKLADSFAKHILERDLKAGRFVV